VGKKHCTALVRALAAALAIVAAGSARESLAAVSYSTVDSTLTENFDSLPTDLPQNGNIQSTAYTSGWRDDTTTVPGTHISLPGWHLYHPTDPSGTEDGFNMHQRLRSGPGSANTGAFYLFGASSDDPEKALGAVGSTTVAPNNSSMFIGLQLTNNTGETLGNFTLTYNGEQWRHGNGNLENLTLSYSTSATDADWFDPTNASFMPATTLTFVPPVLDPPDSAVDGNSAGRVSDITGTVGNIVWAPGTDLWLRWADVSVAGNDDGLAIDDVRFMAGTGPGPSTDIMSVMSGLASAPSTWSNNEAPSAANHYRVVSGHTVTVDGPFGGADLTSNMGGAVNFSATGIRIPLLVIDEGGALTESVAGDFALGNTSQALGGLTLNETIGFDIDANSDFRLDMTLTGTGDLNFNSGANSQLWLSDTQGHDGTIRFNGSGSRVNMTENNGGVGTLEMNSTGANILYFDPKVQADGGTVVFNQTGTIDHAATQSSPVRRLHGMSILVANAPVTVDLTKVMPDGAEERRLIVGSAPGTGLQGGADITVNGMNVDPTSGSVTLNEFEVGSTGEPGTLAVDTFTGTLSANDYVNVEIRHSVPGGRFVVNDHARLEMGHQTVASAHSIAMGEVVLNSGGVLEVGFEQGPLSDVFPEGHHAYHLSLVSTDGRSGGLTLNSGATLRMQINGTTPDLYDSISAQGSVALGGTLELLISPNATSGTSSTPVDLADYAPTLGDTFNLITLSSANPAADFNNSGAVDAADLETWKTGFGTDATADADADGDTDGADFLAWQRGLGEMGVMGTITGDFNSVVVVDPNNTMVNAGLAFQIVKTATAVQLVVVSAATAVPEPAGAVLAVVACLLPTIRRRK